MNTPFLMIKQLKLFKRQQYHLNLAFLFEIIDTVEAETQVFFYNSDESTDHWRKVAFALIGSVSTLIVIGLLIFLKSW